MRYAYKWFTQFISNSSENACILINFYVLDEVHRLLPRYEYLF